MTAAVWKTCLEQFAQHGTTSEQLMARMLLMTMNLPGAEAIVDNFALNLLEDP